MNLAVPLDSTAPTRAKNALLRARGLRKSYDTPQGRLPVLRGVDIDVCAGESVALMGESGCGKSTLLHLVAGLDAADKGEIWLDGALMSSLSERARAARRRETIGVVFQQFNLIASLNVGDNLAFQARVAGRDDPAWREELIARLSLRALLSRYPEQLSGGQQQRVAIGRALAVRPRLIIADEPTGSLDEATGDDVLALALQLVAESGCAFLMATHSARLAARLDRKVVLSSGSIA